MTRSPTGPRWPGHSPTRETDESCPGVSPVPSECGGNGRATTARIRWSDSSALWRKRRSMLRLCLSIDDVNSNVATHEAEPLLSKTRVPLQHSRSHSNENDEPVDSRVERHSDRRKDRIRDLSQSRVELDGGESGRVGDRCNQRPGPVSDVLRAGRRRDRWPAACRRRRSRDCSRGSRRRRSTG